MFLTLILEIRLLLWAVFLEGKACKKEKPAVWWSHNNLTINIPYSRPEKKRVFILSGVSSQKLEYQLILDNTSRFLVVFTAH